MADANKHTVIKAGQTDADSLRCPPFHLLLFSVYESMCNAGPKKKVQWTVFDVKA